MGCVGGWVCRWTARSCVCVWSFRAPTQGTESQKLGRIKASSVAPRPAAFLGMPCTKALWRWEGRGRRVQANRGRVSRYGRSWLLMPGREATTTTRVSRRPQATQHPNKPRCLAGRQGDTLCICGGGQGVIQREWDGFTAPREQFSAGGLPWACGRACPCRASPLSFACCGSNLRCLQATDRAITHAPDPSSIACCSHPHVLHKDTRVATFL